MKDLLNEIQSLKDSKIKNTINTRIKEFKSIDKQSNEKIFNEICFCILTANFNAEKTIKIQNEIGQSFCNCEKNQLINNLKKYGHRFPNNRADYIYDSRKCINDLNQIIKNQDGLELRNWFVDNIKGLGLKEASHFLRNIGFDDYAIIDFHIIDLLVKYNLIHRPKSLTKKKYLEIEEILRNIAKKTNLTLAELDLYLWYMETGKILK